MVLELEPAQLGTLELDGIWVPYVDLVDEPFLPSRVRIGADEYGFHSSIIIFGHSALLSQKVRELRAAGKKVMVIERAAQGTGHSDRYMVYASPA
jgi:hypothetical protein